MLIHGPFSTLEYKLTLPVLILKDQRVYLVYEEHYPRNTKDAQYVYKGILRLDKAD